MQAAQGQPKDWMWPGGNKMPRSALVIYWIYCIGYSSSDAFHLAIAIFISLGKAQAPLTCLSLASLVPVLHFCLEVISDSI